MIVLYYFFGFSILSLLAVLFQSSAIGLFAQLEAFPDIVLIISVFTSYSYGRLFGESVGLVSGLVEDFISATPFGVNVLMRVVVGFVIGCFATRDHWETLLLPILLTIIALAGKFIILVAIAGIFSIGSILAEVFSAIFLYKSLMTILFAPFVFSLLSIVPRISGRPIE